MWPQWAHKKPSLHTEPGADGFLDLGIFVTIEAMTRLTTVATGNRAEQAAAEYLIRAGYDVIDRNYRRKHCEIDIVARRDSTVYFVEVKYRADDHFGGGLAYIGHDKLRHMERAALTWVTDRHWDGEYTLSAIEVGGDYEVLNFIESIW